MALQADGWWVRSDIIWHKPNPMPESVTDRPTKSKEYVFLLSKSAQYFYDADAIREENSISTIERLKYYKQGFAEQHKIRANPMRSDTGRYDNPNGRNKRDVWTIATMPFSGAHFATMPQELAETCIKAGCPVGGMVLDPFGGAGTTALAAVHLGRMYQLIELSPLYAGIAQQRIQNYDPHTATTLPDGAKQLSLFSEVSA
jgi:DNA modification methylase